MSQTRVCILTAGMGTRMGPSFAWLNKALLQLDERAVISHLIERFPADAEFVIGLGHLGDQVREYLRLMHPDRVFHFTPVRPWSGRGSGPGRSLLCCREHLEGSFYFVPCDTIPAEPVNTEIPGDWVGVQAVEEADRGHYCNFMIDDGCVTSIFDKQPVSNPDSRAFTGLMRIESSSDFWNALEDSTKLGNGEKQISAGLASLVSKGLLRAHEHAATDVGTLGRYRAEVSRRGGFDFSKPGETLSILNGRVLKHFADHELATKRKCRAAALGRAVPEMLTTSGGFLGYRFVEGETLYRCITPDMLGHFFDWAETNLWRPVSISETCFTRACKEFYRSKTLARVESLRAKGGLCEQPARINGRDIPALDELLADFPWDRLETGGKPAVIHGDLQFDNILRTGDSFVLIDWRQDFAGRTDAGDLDYDLAKMLGGIRIAYAEIKAGNLSRELREDGSVETQLASMRDASVLETMLIERSESLGRDPERLSLLTAIIHLNMAPLHEEPFRSCLVDFARRELSDALIGSR